MAETSRFWDGTTTGDATEAPYNAPTEFSDILRAILGMNLNNGYVFFDDLNKLEVTGTSSPVSVNTGRAMVYGAWYQNTAAVTVAIPTPSGATRIDRIVLRKDWSAQTVRITRIAGVEGGSAPALVQVAGTTWDIPLGNVSITTGSVITVTDTREFQTNTWVTRRKTANQVVNNSTTLVNDLELRFPLEANKRYAVRGVLFFTANESADMDATWSLPASATFGMKAERIAAGSDTVTTIFWNTEELFQAGDAALGRTMIYFEGEILVGATAGVAILQYAQNVLGANDLTMRAGSFVEYLKESY